MRLFRKLLKDRKGGTAMEYALICSLVIIAMIAALQNFSGAVVRLLNNVSTNVVSAS